MSFILNDLFSHFENAGFKILTDFLNQDQKIGLFMQNGKPFFHCLDKENNKKNVYLKYANYVLDVFNGTATNNTETYAGLDNDVVRCGVQGFNYTASSTVSKAPLEVGGFSAYNKVLNPINGQITYIVTGTMDQRTYFHKAIDFAQKSLLEFTFYASEHFVQNVNIVDYTIARDQSNCQLFNCSITFQEIMEQAVYKNGQQTAYNGDTENSGNLQPQSATSQIENWVKKAGKKIKDFF